MHMAQKADNKAMNNVSQEERNKQINVNEGKAKTKYFSKFSSDKKDNVNNEETTKKKPKRNEKVGNEEIELTRAIQGREAKN